MYKCLSILLLASFILPSLEAQETVPPIQVELNAATGEYTFSVDTSLLPDLTIYPNAYFAFFWHFGDGVTATQQGDNSREFSIPHTFSPRWEGKKLKAQLYISVHYAPYYYAVPGEKAFAVEATAPVDSRPPSNNCLSLRTNDFFPSGKHEIRLNEAFLLLASVHCSRPINNGKLRIRTKPRSKGLQFSVIGYDAPGGSITPSSSSDSHPLDAGLELPIHNLGNERETVLLILKTADKQLLNKEVDFEVTLMENNQTVETETMTFSVVATRDPNQMWVQTMMVEDFDEFFENGLEYRIDFQNASEQPVLDGKGPDDGIVITIELPRGADSSTFELRAFHTATRSNGAEPPDSADWTLLPSEQKDEIVVKLYGGLGSKSSKQRSKGFMSYSISPRSNIGKCPWESVAHVQFGGATRKETTNEVKSEFKGLTSLGIKTGYNFFPTQEDRNYYFAGIELSSDLHCISNSRLAVTAGVETFDSLFQKNYYLDIALTAIHFDPFRIDNGRISLFGVGAGVQYSKAFLLDNEGNRVKPNLWTLFLNVNPISIRKGPRLGVQAHWNISNVNVEALNADFEKSQLQFYATWAF